MPRLTEPPSPDRDPRPMPVQATPRIVSELAPTGVLRAAIKMGNFLLVTGKCPNGDPSGVSPDMAAAIAARLGVPVKFIPYARPGEIADDAEKGSSPPCSRRSARRKRTPPALPSCATLSRRRRRTD